MMDPAKIKPPQDLEAFLSDWPAENGPGGLSRQQAATWIAWRAAMRVLPVYWEWVLTSKDARERDLSPLPILRLLLVLGLAAKKPSPEIKDIGLAAFNHASVYSSTEAATGAARAAIHSADVAIYAAADAGDALKHVLETSAQATADAADILEQAVADVNALANERNLTQTPLWNGFGNPLQADWDEIKMRLPRGGSEETARGATPDDWTFWMKWYEDALAGREPNWTMLEEIALIRPETWTEGPSVVNPLINQIWAKHLNAATWNAEVIAENPATGRLQVAAASDLPDTPRQDIQTKLSDIADTFDGQGGPNGPYAELEPEVELVRKAAAWIEPRPIRLYDLCRRASRRALMRVGRGECPKDDPLVEDFIGQLDEAAFDIMSANPDVAAVAASRAQIKLREADPEQGRILQVVAAQLAEHAEPELAEELVEDADQALDARQPDEVRNNALYVTASRLVRIYRGVRVALREIRDLSQDIAVISKNLAIALASYPALQAAVTYLLSLF